MIKDILVSAPVGASSTPAIDYAILVATTFDAHLAGVAFVYQPIVPGMVFDGVAANLVESFRAESEKAGKAAVAKFEDAARRAGLPVESHLLDSEAAGAGEMFAQFARHFDLSVVAQIEPEKDVPLYVLKSRGMSHSNQIREYQITNNGIRLLDVYRSTEGVLVGSARRQAQAVQQKKARAAATGKLASKARRGSKAQGKSL